MKKNLFLSFLCLLSLNLASQQAHAAMTNDNYTIDQGDVDIMPFATPTKTATVQYEKLQPRQLEGGGENYTVRSNDFSPFGFTISNGVVDFGKLSATNPVIRTSDIAITSNRPYTVFAIQSNPLRLNERILIPDTTCDNGSCSETTAAPWVNTLTYGFGYRCDDTTCQRDFKDKTYYRQFSDNTKQEIPQVILQGAKNKNTPAKITYKINISGTQQEGSYNNIITYIATPSY
jgi:hypothetical protein